MRIFKLSLFTFLTCIVLSCSTDENQLENENTIATTVNLADADLLGTWTGIDVSYSGSITTTNGGVTTVQNTQGSNFNGNYTVTFSESPSIITGEGLYSIDEEVTDTNGNNSTRTINNLNLINSLTNWTLVDDQLTIDSNTKIIVATIIELTSSSLVLTIIENNTSTINNITTVEDKNATFVFTR